jgi:hypothetical protein
MKSYHNILPF